MCLVSLSRELLQHGEKKKSKLDKYEEAISYLYKNNHTILSIQAFLKNELKFDVAYSTLRDYCDRRFNNQDTLKEGFVEFFENIKDPLKDEYLLPIYIGELLRENKLSVKVLEVQDSWFGVTYKEDAPVVKESFKKLIDEGVYSSNLFDNIK